MTIISIITIIIIIISIIIISIIIIIIIIIISIIFSIVIRPPVQGRDVTPDSFALYVEQYVKLFKDGSLPETPDLVTAIATATNLNAKAQALAEYKCAILPVRDGSFLGVEELLAVCNCGVTVMLL
jgi:hypothetical protein